MIKGEVVVLQGVCEAIFRDYLVSYPSDTKEVERDLLHLSLAVQTRGLATFLLDLPALGKHFDRCLSDGSLVLSRLPLGAPRWKTSSIPKFLSGMMMKVFERDSGSLRTDVDVNIIMFLRQIFFFAKGFNHDCSLKRTTEAVREFYATEREIRTPALNWASDRIELSSLGDLRFDDPLSSKAPDVGSGIPDQTQSDCLQRFFGTLAFCSDHIAAGFGEFDASEWTAKHGPGAVSDLQPGVSKFSFPNWSAKLDHVFPYSEFAFVNYDDWIDNHDQPCFDSEPSSKLLTVPKTAKGPRLIASEPTSQQWCQQAILKFLLHGIQRTSLRHSISLKDQEPSRALVLTASHTRNNCTIDLSAASDRVSCWLVERVFRRNPTLIEAFHAVRTRTIRNGTKIPLDEPELLTLKKFTTMGSACTFPVQSIVFSIIAIATILSEEGTKLSYKAVNRAARRVRVFGDDIILPTEHFDAVSRYLSVLGLKVNHTKSFAKGNFRESCGMDAWGGFDVTPAHLNAVPDYSRPSSVIAAVDAANNFFLKGYWLTAKAIESALPQWIRKNLAVVTHGSGKTGLKSFVGFDNTPLRRRENLDLQRTEVRTIALRSVVNRASQSGRHDLFQYFTEKPAPDTVWEPGRVREVSQYLRLAWEPLDCLEA